MYEVLFEIENVTKNMTVKEIETKIKQETSIDFWFCGSKAEMIKQEKEGFIIFKENKLIILGDI